MIQPHAVKIIFVILAAKHHSHNEEAVSGGHLFADEQAARMTRSRTLTNNFPPGASMR